MTHSPRIREEYDLETRHAHAIECLQEAGAPPEVVAVRKAVLEATALTNEALHRQVGGLTMHPDNCEMDKPKRSTQEMCGVAEAPSLVRMLRNRAEILRHQAHELEGLSYALDGNVLTREQQGVLARALEDSWFRR